MGYSFWKNLESIQDNLDTRKVSESTTHSRLSEPDTVADLYRIGYIRASCKLVIISSSWMTKKTPTMTDATSPNNSKNLSAQVQSATSNIASSANDGTNNNAEIVSQMRTLI